MSDTTNTNSKVSTEEEIVKKLNLMLTTDGGKKFLAHLFYSYYPVSKVGLMWSNPKNKKMVCCLSGQPLMSKDDAFQCVQQMNPDEFVKHLAYSIVPEEGQEPVEHPMVKLVAGRVLAVEVEESDKLMSNEAWNVFNNWCMNNMLMGDPYLNYLSKNAMMKAGLASWKSNGQDFTPREEKVLKQVVVEKKKINSLEDNDALKSLREKLLKAEQSEKD